MINCYICHEFRLVKEGKFDTPLSFLANGGENMKKENTANTSVVIYTTTECPWCKKTKEFFKENNVKYSEVNVQEDENARNEIFEKSGQMGVPVVDVGGKIIVGFDKNALKMALKI